MLLLGRSVLGQIIHLVYTFYKEQKMLVYVPAWGYQLLLDRERDTLVEEKEKKFSHEDDGISKVDIVNSNFPPNRVIRLIFHIKYCIRLIGLEVACLLHMLKVLGSNPGANKIAILSLFPKSGGKFELRMSTL